VTTQTDTKRKSEGSKIMFLVKRKNQERGPLGLLSGGMDSLFNRFFEDWPLADRRAGLAMPVVDLAEAEDNFLVHAELPGLTDEDIELSVMDDVLTISGEKKAEEQTEEKNYYHVERRYGTFRRDIHLPAPVDADNVTANYTNGVLTVTLPKSEKSKAMAIKIGK